jgi:hypothetical protein
MAECCYAECRYAECRYAECRYAECRYAECRYSVCRGALSITTFCRMPFRMTSNAHYFDCRCVITKNTKGFYSILF